MFRFLFLVLLVTGCDYLEHDAQEANARATREIAFQLSGIGIHVAGLEQTVAVKDRRIDELHLELEFLYDQLSMEDQTKWRVEYYDKLYCDNVQLARCCTQIHSASLLSPEVRPTIRLAPSFESAWGFR